MVAILEDDILTSAAPPDQMARDTGKGDALKPGHDVRMSLRFLNANDRGAAARIGERNILQSAMIG